MTRRFVSTVADPLERGREFGRVHADRVAATAAGYRRLFATYGPDPELEVWGGDALARIDAWAPELGTEIRGIAEGAGLAVAEVAAVNARTEILARLRRMSTSLPVQPDECSTVVAVGATPSFAVQNWDWYDAMAGNWLEWTIVHPNGRRVTTVTEYGMVGKIGINDRGLGVLLNMLRHREDGAGIAVPVHVVSRRILDAAADVATALAICASASVSASTALTIVTPRQAVSVELWPGGPGHVLVDEDGLLVRTNHFLTAAAQPGDTTPGSESDTLERYGELHGQLAGRGRELTPATVVGLLGSHPGWLCCHPDPDEIPELRHATLATVRLDLTELTLAAHAGPPCQLLPGSVQHLSVSRVGEGGRGVEHFRACRPARYSAESTSTTKRSAPAVAPRLGSSP